MSKVKLIKVHRRHEEPLETLLGKVLAGQRSRGLALKIGCGGGFQLQLELIGNECDEFRICAFLLTSNPILAKLRMKAERDTVGCSLFAVAVFTTSAIQKDVSFNTEGTVLLEVLCGTSFLF